MGKKLLGLIGIGAGVVLVRKQLKNNPEGPVAKTVRAVKDNPAVQKATDSAKAKASQVIKEQGEAVTDKVAEAVKERVFGVSPAKSNEPDPIYVDIEVEEVDPAQQK